MTLPGRVMLSEAECLKKVRRPVTDKNGKQLYDRNGNPKYKTCIEYDYSKTDRTIVSIYDKEKDTREDVNVYTRKCKPAQRSLSVSQENYNMYISKDEVPTRFRGGRVKWRQMSDTERLEWNLNDLCESLGGVMESYYILK